MKEKLALFVLFILNICINAQGNLVEDYSISKKANVSNLYNTGKVGLSIPLYKIDLGDLTLQSSLSYKQEIPEGEPSMVGTNWDLNTFGKIVVAHAMPGKLLSPFVLLNGAAQGYNVPKEKEGMTLNYCLLKEKIFPSKYNILNSPNSDNTQYSPNTYYFDFLGYTGYMVYDNTGKLLVHSEQGELKAEFYGDKCYGLYQVINTVPQIVMKDDKGNQFYFGGDFNSADIYYGNIHYTSKWDNAPGDYYTNSHTNYISALYLKKVVLASGRTLEAFYKEGNKSIMDPYVNGGVYKEADYPYGIPSKATLLSNNLFVGVDDAKQFDNLSISVPATTGSPTINTKRTYTTIYQKIAVLDSIKVSNYGTINFNYVQLSNQLTKPFLSSVKVYQKKKNINTINFSYIKLNNSTYLQSLFNNEDPYHFNYYTDFTGTPNTGGLIKAIMYPTKGIESFEYEPNWISKRNVYTFDNDPLFGSSESSVLINLSKTVEGHRLKTIKKESETDSYTKNYYYTTDDGFTDSGIQTFYTNESSTSVTFAGSVSHNISFKGKFDDYVRYSQVTEDVVGKEKTKYYFTDLLTNPDSIAAKTYGAGTVQPYYSVKINKNNERGKLYKIEKYNNDNSLVFKQETKYTNFLNNANPVSEISPVCTTCKITDDKYYITGKNAYYQYQPILPYLPIQVKTQEKVGNNFSESTKYFRYNTSYLYWHSYPIEEKTESLGKITTRKTYFPGDILQKNPSCITGNCPSDTDLAGEKFSIYKDMTVNNFNYPIVVTQTNHSGKTSLTESIYKRNSTFANLLKLDKTRTSLNSNFTASNYNQAELQTKEINELYDNVGNILQSRTENGIPTTTLWGYNQTSPIAKITGATYGQVMTALGLDGNNLTSYLQSDIVKKSDLDIDDASEDVLYASLNNFRNTLSDYQMTTSTFDPLIGVKSVTPPSGITEFYKYDVANRVEKVLDLNKNIQKEYTYNYKEATKYLSDGQSQAFLPNNCNAIQTPNLYTYNVAPGIYTSYFTVDEANAQAMNDINMNGQNTANTNGTCTNKPFDCTITTEFAYNDMSSYFFNKINNISHEAYSGTICFNTKNHSWAFINGQPRRKVGKINGICKPRVYKSKFEPFGWSLSIDSNGDIYVEWENTFSNVEHNKTVIINFVFPFDK